MAYPEAPAIQQLLVGGSSLQPVLRGEYHTRRLGWHLEEWSRRASNH